jgi:photosystem II stability/assembly factor-like uncharacterized protein
MIHRKFIAAAVFTASILGGQIALPAQSETQPATRWTSVANDLGGDKWGFGGVTIMAAVPGSDTVIAGVSECGLWATHDGGKTWTRLGAKDGMPIANHPYQIIFDPKNPRTFWESGNTGPGIFRTDDGGETFVRLGMIENVDGLGIDFTDAKRQTLVVGLHEQERSTEKSIDGGKTWQTIGDKLPAKTNISNDVLVVDASTYLVNAAGWKRDGAAVLAFGIYRTDDGGKSFAKVSDDGPSGPALVASDGAIYWETLWNKGLIKSTDNGKTWQPLAGPVMVNPIELPGGKLLAAVDSQLYVSADAGKSWQQMGDPIPFKPSGLAFSAQTRSLYAWRSTEAKEEFVIARWELP